MNLLDRAKRLLQGEGPSASRKPQYYNVLCPDGHRISGARNEGYQALRCPSCGEGVFILPRSPLPEVSAPPRPVQRASRPAASEADVLDEPIALSDPPSLPPRDDNEEFTDIDWEDEVQETSTRNAATQTDAAPANGEARQPSQPAARSLEPGRRPKPRTEPPRDARAQPAARSRPAFRPSAPAAPEEPPFDLRDWVRRRRNPLIFTTVGLILAATIGVRLWRSNLEDYPRVAELGRTEGLDALDRGEWDKAHQLLSKARRAVDALGGNVEGAEEIRHGADEAALYANLVSETMESLLRSADPAETSDWPAEFARLYKGKAIVVRAEVIAVPGPDGRGGYDLDYRILPSGEGDLNPRRDRVGRFDLSKFKLFHDLQPKVGTQLAFGARLRSFTFDAERNEWLVGLEPDSGVVLQHDKALAIATMTDDPSSAPEEGKR